MARHLAHDTARNARFSIGIVNAAYIGIFSAGQQPMPATRVLRFSLPILSG